MIQWLTHCLSRLKHTGPGCGGGGGAAWRRFGGGAYGMRDAIAGRPAGSGPTRRLTHPGGTGSRAGDLRGVSQTTRRARCRARRVARCVAEVMTSLLEVTEGSAIKGLTVESHDKF